MKTITDFEDITNSTTTITTMSDGPHTDSTPPTNNDDLKIILIYAIPLSCLAILIVIVIIFSIRRRQQIVDKWNSLTQMKNIDPKFRHSAGIRRDSEFDSYDADDVRTTTINQDNSNKDQEYRLTTIL